MLLSAGTGVARVVMKISGLSCCRPPFASETATVTSFCPDASCKMGSLLSAGSAGVGSGWVPTGDGGLLSTRCGATATTTTGGGPLAIATGASFVAGAVGLEAADEAAGLADAGGAGCAGAASPPAGSGPGFLDGSGAVGSGATAGAGASAAGAGAGACAGGAGGVGVGVGVLVVVRVGVGVGAATGVGAGAATGVGAFGAVMLLVTAVTAVMTDLLMTRSAPV